MRATRKQRALIRILELKGDLSPTVPYGEMTITDADREIKRLLEAQRKQRKGGMKP
jgi:hypothetical protein